MTLLICSLLVKQLTPVAVRDHATFQASHPVGEAQAGNLAEGLEALREQRQRRVGPLIMSEAHKPDPAPRLDRAEHVQSAQHTPIDDQMPTGDHTAGRRPR